MSDDKSNQSQPPQSPSTPDSAPSEPRRPEPPQDLFSTVRRIADEHISAALHSVFGIPSILHTPSSNWIIEEDRNQVDGVTRREGADDSGRDDDNQGSGGSGATGSSGPSGSSGQSGTSPSSGSSSDRNRDDNSSDVSLSRLLLPPAVLLPEMLFSLGVQSADILERHFSNHVKELDRLIQEEAARQKEISASQLQKDFGPFQQEFKRLFELEAALNKIASGSKHQDEKDMPHSQTIVIRGTQTNDEAPKFTVTKFPGIPPSMPQSHSSSIWKDLFGEDMYGSQRTHPLFTSLFDEFLPDGHYNKREQPPSPLGGWTLPGQSGAFPLSLPSDPFGHFFKFVTGPWIRTMHESWDPAYNDATRNVLDRINSERIDNVREGTVSKEDLNRLVQEEQLKIAQEHMKRLNERRQELEKLLHGNEKKRIPDDIKDESAFYHPIPTEYREPETELDLHDFFASVNGKKEAAGGKVLVAQSMSTTSTTGADGITRVKKIRERRYSDGTVERREHQEESASTQPPSLFKDHFKMLEELRKQEREIRLQDGARRVFELEEGEQEAVAVQSENKEDSEGKKHGGWSNWMWASGKKD
ncbi:hypothetical protein TWF696_007156 [Orbilia brochopaga]|uniref:Uncharacterized protein n=1 Tax=Orbilia brochopaga TaxID=3140254 RepID=A0AAV9UXQ8_9PEZI